METLLALHGLANHITLQQLLHLFFALKVAVVVEHLTLTFVSGSLVFQALTQVDTESQTHLQHLHMVVAVLVLVVLVETLLVMPLRLLVVSLLLVMEHLAQQCFRMFNSRVTKADTQCFHLTLPPLLMVEMVVQELLLTELEHLLFHNSAAEAAEAVGTLSHRVQTTTQVAVKQVAVRVDTPTLLI